MSQNWQHYSASKHRRLFLLKFNNIMKRLTLIIGVILLIINIAIGLIISAYSSFNMVVNCGIIAIVTGMIYALSIVHLRDAYRISLALLFAFLGIVEIVLGCLMPQQVQDNWYLLIEIILLSFEVLMILITNFMSNN